MRAFAIIALLLLSSAAFAADEGASNMRAYCLTLLDINATQNQTAVPAPVQIAVANNSTNFTLSKEYYGAYQELQSGNDSLHNIEAAGFSYLAARDTYLLAEQWLAGQAALEVAGEQADYTFVYQQVSQLKTMETDAFAASDNLKALALRINETSPGVNLTEVLGIQSQARSEFADGRFQESSTLANSAYDKITAAEADASRNSALLESTRRNLETFLQDNWQIIVAAIAAIAIIGFLFQKQIRRFLTNAKIRALVAERTVLENMIKSLQREYFESGKVNELSYHIKTKKFGDLIRNINRQLPLLREELKKL